jgi:hypothetical protein
MLLGTVSDMMQAFWHCPGLLFDNFMILKHYSHLQKLGNLRSRPKDNHDQDSVR